MTERKTLVNITHITDHPTGMYYMGEILGVFQERELAAYLQRYDERGRADLICHLAFLQSQVVEAWSEIQRARLKAAHVQAKDPAG